MERLFIDKDMATFVRRDLTLVDVTFHDGRTIENVEPRRLFPISDRSRYIALLNESGTEQAVIRDLSVLPEADQRIIEDCLQEYYLVPKITCIRECKERFDGITLFTETDHGPANIEIRVLNHGLRMANDFRALIRDVNDNRYEIPDVSRLDKHSRQILARYL